MMNYFVCVCTVVFVGGGGGGVQKITLAVFEKNSPTFACKAVMPIHYLPS